MRQNACHSTAPCSSNHCDVCTVLLRYHLTKDGLEHDGQDIGRCSPGGGMTPGYWCLLGFLSVVCAPCLVLWYVPKRLWCQNDAFYFVSYSFFTCIYKIKFYNQYCNNIRLIIYGILNYCIGGFSLLLDSLSSTRFLVPFP